MAQKIIVSKSGYNVLTETDPNNLIFSSDYNTLKYHVSGSGSITVGAGAFEQTTTVAHNLGYIPFFFGLGRISSWTAGLYNMLPITNHFSEDMEIFADSTNIYLYTQGFNSTGGNLTYLFYYKIFKNNLGL